MVSRSRKTAAALLGVVASLSACRQPATSGEGELAGAVRTEGEVLLARSIALHDPRGRWAREALRVRWSSLGPNGEERIGFDMTMGPADRFSMRGTYAGTRIDYRTAGGEWSAEVDGEPEPGPAALERAVLDREDGLFWRNYFGFLGGLPMCLAGADLELAPDPASVSWEGEDVYALEVRFPAEVGRDLWEFYFAREDAELVGCKFWRTDPSSDGETLVFEGLVELDGVFLPESRHWFRNADGELLGTDVLAPLRRP